MAENIDWEFIASLEGKGVTTGYVPDPTGSKSGVTIATGFDLGARNESDLTSLGLSSALITKFKPYLGLQGTTADDFLKKNPLTITEAEATDIDSKVKAKKVPALKQKYINSAHNTAKVAFDDLPSQAQTVIASVSFQYGDLPSKTPKFWTAASSQDWVESVKILRNFGDSYRTRRGKEADLLEQVVKFNELVQQVLRWNLIWFMSFVVMLSTVGCSVGFGKNPVIIYDQNLSKALENYDSSIVEPKKEINFESGAKAANCQQFWEAKEKSSVKEDVANMMFMSEYLICDALSILRKADIQGEAVSQDNASKYTIEIFSRLDLTSFPNSFAQTIDNNATFETQKEKMLAKINNNTIVSDTKDWNFSLKIAAAADVNKNGKQDLIVWVTDKSKEGNFQSYSTILIYDVENQGLLKAKIQ